MYKEMKITSPIKRTESARLFEASKTFFPGGVNSPVRAFKSVGGTPLFIKKGNGAVIWDEDDNEFIDFLLTILDEAAIVLTVVLHLFISLEAWTSLFFIFVPIDSGHDSHYGFEKQKHVV